MHFKTKRLFCEIYSILVSLKEQDFQLETRSAQGTSEGIGRPSRSDQTLPPAPVPFGTYPVVAPHSDVLVTAGAPALDGEIWALSVGATHVQVQLVRLKIGQHGLETHPSQERVFFLVR